MLVSLLAAIIAAVFYGVASVIQAIAVRAASHRAPEDAAGAVDPRLAVRLLRQWRFVASICLDALGFIAQLVALHRLPLFAVQAFVASNLAVTAVAASWVIGVTLSWREWLAVFGVVAGVAVLGASAGAEGAAQVGTAFKLALIVAVASLAVVGMAVAKLNEPFRTVALGLTAGLGFGVLAVAARVLTGFAPPQLARDPAAYVIAAAGIVSFMLYATALEAGSVTVATAAVVLSETVPPAIIGVIFLGDQTRHSLASLAWAGFGVAVASALLLARFGEAHHAEDVERADAVARRHSDAGPAACGLLSWRPASTGRRTTRPRSSRAPCPRLASRGRTSCRTTPGGRRCGELGSRR